MLLLPTEKVTQRVNAENERSPTPKPAQPTNSLSLSLSLSLPHELIFHSSELDPIKLVHSAAQHSIQSKFPSSGHLVTTTSFQGGEQQDTFSQDEFILIDKRLQSTMALRCSSLFVSPLSHSARSSASTSLKNNDRLINLS